MTVSGKPFTPPRLRRRRARHGSSIALALLATLAAGSAFGQVPDQRDPRLNRLFSPQDLGLLEGPDRDSWQKPDQVMDALGIADGAEVADLGAGGGW